MGARGRGRAPSRYGARKTTTGRRGKPLALYLEPTQGYRIVDDAGKPYTVSEAEAAWTAGRVANDNLAF